MDYKDLEKMSTNELQKMLAEERGNLFGLRLKTSVNQLKDLRAIRKAKKNIARIQTRMSELRRTEASE